MISLDKKYRYRNGTRARVFIVDGPDVLRPVHSLTEGGNMVLHDTSGRHYIGEGDVSDYDLIVDVKSQKLDRLSCLALYRETLDAEIARLEAELDAEEQP